MTMRKVFWCCVAAGAAVCCGLGAAAFVAHNPDSPLGRCARAVCPLAPHAGAAAAGRAAAPGTADVEDLVPPDPVPVDDPPPLPPPGSHVPPEVAALMTPPLIVIHDEEDLNPQTNPPPLECGRHHERRGRRPPRHSGASAIWQGDWTMTRSRNDPPARHSMPYCSGERRPNAAHAVLHGGRGGRGRGQCQPLRRGAASRLRRLRLLGGFLHRPVAPVRQLRLRPLRRGRSLPATVFRCALHRRTGRIQPGGPAGRVFEAGAGRAGRGGAERAARPAGGDARRRLAGPPEGVAAGQSRSPTRWRCGPATGSRTALPPARSEMCIVFANPPARSEARGVRRNPSLAASGWSFAYFAAFTVSTSRTKSRAGTVSDQGRPVGRQHDALRRLE